MIVDYLDIERISLLPEEADAILVIDSNAVLSDAIAFESFQFVTARSRKIAQLLSRVQSFQLPPHRPLDMPQRWYILLFKKSFCANIAEAPDHADSIPRLAVTGKRKAPHEKGLQPRFRRSNASEIIASMPRQISTDAVIEALGRYAGQSVGLIARLAPAGEIVRQIAAEARDVIASKLAPLGR